MAIEKPLVIPQNSKTADAHEVLEVLVYYEGKVPKTSVKIKHWKDKAAYLQKGEVVWFWNYDSIVTVGQLDNLEEALVTNENSPFYGGVLFDTGAVEDKAAVRRSKWLEIKAEYDRRSTAELQTPFGSVDADEFSQLQMLKANALAQGLEKAKQPVAIPWSMADGSVVVLTSSTQVMSMGFALAARELGLRVKRNELKSLLDTPDATKKQIRSISWDSTELVEDLEGDEAEQASLSPEELSLAMYQHPGLAPAAPTPEPTPAPAPPPPPIDS